MNPLQNLDQGANRLKTANNTLYFASDRYIQYDGENFSYVPVNFNPVTVYNMLAYKNNFYYERETGRFSGSLFKFNGTTEELLSNTATSDLIVFHDTIYYGSHNNDEFTFMKYDGNTEPVAVANLGSLIICFMEIVNDKIVIFAHNNDSLSIALFDGKILSWQHKDLHVPYNYKFSGILFNDNIVFSYNSIFWIYDGTNQPKKLAEIYSGFDCWETAPNFTIYKDKLYFRALDIIHGRELWAYDGLSSPAIVADIVPGSESSDPLELTVVKDKFYFTAFNKDTGYELWEFNGIQEPQVVDDFQGKASSYPLELTVFRDNLYFTATREDEVREIYKVCTNCTTIHETACDSLVFKGNTLKKSGIYYDTLSDYQGNDSIIKLDLTIVKPTSNVLNITVCDKYISASGKYNWETSGVYSDTIPNTAGCDSIITVNLNVNHSTGTTVYVESCESYTSPGCFMRNSSGTYKDTIPNACGCDSVMTINLQIDHVDTAVIQDRNVLVSEDLNAAHQWIDAETNSFIEGETFLTYTPDQTGSYAVIVTQGTCVDTSSAYTVIVTGNTNANNGNIQIYPNPNKGRCTIDLGKLYETADITLITTSGNLIGEIKMKNSQKQEFILNEAPGIYLVKIRTRDGVTILKVSKE